MFIFIARALCKLDSGVALIALYDRLLQEKRDREGRRGHGISICGLQSRGRARGWKSRDSRLEEEDLFNTLLSIESKTDFATGVMAPKMDVTMNSFLAELH